MNTHLHKIILSILFLILATSIYAQQITVTGTVIDESDGLGIPGATVLVKGTTNGTITDLDGIYTLVVPNATDTLVFSYIGYVTLDIPINGKAVIDISMIVEQTELEEIVVIGYGTQKKKVVTGAIATVKSEEISRTPILRVEQAMQGRTAGVQVTQLSGQPGELTPSQRGCLRQHNPSCR